jgi:hypothetical protein
VQASMADFGGSVRERDSSRPATPTGSTRTFKASGGMRALDTRTKQSETFFDDATPVDNRRSGASDHDPLRDSHDLSFASGTRDSVVDNMLLSLDSFGPMQFGQPAPAVPNFSDPFLLADNHYPPPNASRQRGHTYTSSQSSDYDLHVDDTASRYSNHHSRSRRSNSSNNIPNVAGGRKWSASKQAGIVSGDYQQTRHARGVGQQGSKGSGSSSMDFGHAGVLNTHRLGLGSRAASFDHGNTTGRSSPVKTESILARSRPIPAYENFHHEYDAAPQPTVPAGPRRAAQESIPQSPAYPSQPTYAPPQAPIPRRKGSVRSTSSYRTLRSKNKTQPSEPNMRLQAQEFVNASNLRDLPALPRFTDPPAPSPTVATRKHAPMTPSPQPAPKEKQGFFRRVFGGGLPKSSPQLSNSSANSNVSRMESPSATSQQYVSDVDSPYSQQQRPRTTPNGSNHISSQLKSPRPRVPQTAASMQNLNEQPPPPPTLAKKGSSFFRRRKKSVSESTKPPVVPIEFRTPQKTEMIPPPQPSPGVSSLRKVMNPYLQDYGTPTDGHSDMFGRQMSDDRTPNERTRGFSPEYKPHKDATVRAIKPGSRDEDHTPPSSQGEELKAAHSASVDSPKLKLKIKKPGRPKPGNTQEDSFLADSSSCNEDRSGRATPAGERNASGMAGRQGRGASPDSSLIMGLDGRRDRNVNAGEQRADQLSSQASDARAAPAGSISQSASEVEDDGWVITAPAQTEHASAKGKTGRIYLQEASPKDQSKKTSGSRRVWLEPTSSEERLDGDELDELTLPLEGTRASQKQVQKESPASIPATPLSENDVFHSAVSLPSVQVDGRDTDSMPAAVESRAHHEEPTDQDRERAFRIFGGDETSVQKAQAATILGDVTLTGTRTRKAFMDLFNWTGFSILAAMRDMCGKLVLKAETQQVDRILMSLSERWCECNPNHGFKAIGTFSMVTCGAQLT